jgi:hypothetical protein
MLGNISGLWCTVSDIFLDDNPGGIMKKTGFAGARAITRWSGIAMAVSGIALVAGLMPLRAQQAPPPGVTYLDQGARWKQPERDAFYTQDQGSQVIPLAWIRALDSPNGQPFLADSLTRYGYLVNPATDTGLPVGFTSSGPSGSEMMGMTCAGCHTRDIEVAGQIYRVDGGPAISDFQAFLSDLDTAVAAVRATPAAFDTFATKVLGATATPAQKAALLEAVNLWYDRQHTLFSRSFPADGWGLGRLDAVSMIFNRLTGLDIGTEPNRIIAANIQTADAPVRYPFLWNAPRQDFTQWPGFSANGDDILGLVRNLGEVYGVFAAFAPQQDPHSLFKANYLVDNSANFDGLGRAETLVKAIGAPRWPWFYDRASADRGKLVFESKTSAGGCVECHGIAKGAIRFSLVPTWRTPLQDVGTDTREYTVLARTASTGVLSGTGIPFKRLGPTARQFDILAASVVGSIVQKYTSPRQKPAATAPMNEATANTLLATSLSPAQASLLQAYNFDAATPRQGNTTGTFRYEARVLHGVWAAAPYLHNGSVPTLADLLKPASDRPARFEVGRSYDTNAVGLATTQTGLHDLRQTTGCEKPDSGNSRCGHEFGTSLTPLQKKDLLEYLKTL